MVPPPGKKVEVKTKQKSRLGATMATEIIIDTTMVGSLQIIDLHGLLLMSFRVLSL
jgi:hypothetical protein